jgi:branched-chain amino acid transport system ATP-binding protein
MSLLQVRGLRKSFGSLKVSDDIDLTVAPGELHAVIGPNGAGKTSLVNQLGGQIRPDAGSIQLRGREIAGLPPERICRLGLARTFQRNNLFRDMTVMENVRLAVMAQRGPHYDPFTGIAALTHLAEAAEAKLETVGLLPRAAVPVRNLSYGEQRQLEIGIALAGEPAIMLLDEPTSGMSPSETARVADLIAALSGEVAILLVEHDMDVVFRLADRITVLSRGAVLASGAPAEISANADVRKTYLGGGRR